MDDPEHARLRRMVTAPFAVKRVEALRPAIQRIVDTLIDEMLAGPKPVDLVQAFALPVPSLVICELLGLPYADHDFFQSHSRALLDLSADVQESMRANDELREFLSDKVASWWVPERWAVVDEVPKTSVGKFDKKLLRAQHAAGELKEIGVAPPPVVAS